MSIPGAVFLDTNVLERQHFNFRSTALSTLGPACREHGLKLLLPDPIAREIKRHMEERTKEALDLLEQARRRAPFLADWKGFPRGESEVVLRSQVRYARDVQWTSFLSQFDVVHLGYEDVNFAVVMDWHDRLMAPFREKKRKEFPDAIAIAMLERYAAKNNCYVAVVSDDTDFKVACERFSCLLHFQTLPRLTELLIAEDARVARIHKALDAETEDIEAAVIAEVDAVMYAHVERGLEIVESKRTSPVEIEINLVAVGDNECTVTFDAVWDMEHVLEWLAWQRDPNERPEMIKDSIEESASLSGTAKIGFEANTGAFSGITYLTSETSVLPVTKAPRDYL